MELILKQLDILISYCSNCGMGEDQMFLQLSRDLRNMILLKDNDIDRVIQVFTEEMEKAIQGQASQKRKNLFMEMRRSPRISGE